MIERMAGVGGTRIVVEPLRRATWSRLLGQRSWIDPAGREFGSQRWFVLGTRLSVDDVQWARTVHLRDQVWLELGRPSGSAHRLPLVARTTGAGQVSQPGPVLRAAADLVAGSGPDRLDVAGQLRRQAHHIEGGGLVEQSPLAVSIELTPMISGAAGRGGLTSRLRGRHGGFLPWRRRIRPGAAAELIPDVPDVGGLFEIPALGAILFLICLPFMLLFVVLLIPFVIMVVLAAIELAAELLLLPFVLLARMVRT